MGFYDEDLAHVHDRGFTGFVRDAMPALEELLRAHGIEGGRVVDLGCGSGVWLARLARLGYEPVGIDASAALLALARRRAPDARLLEGSFHAVDLPPCRAVTAIGECFNYVGNSGGAEETLAALLARLHDALEPGGLLVFDLAVPGRVGAEPRRAHALGDDWAVLVEATEDASTGTLERRITTFRRIDGHYRRSEETHRLRLHATDEVLDLARRAGFDPRPLAGYGERRFPAGYAAFVATR